MLRWLLLAGGCGLDVVPGPDVSPDEPPDGTVVEGGDWYCTETSTLGPRQLRLLTREEYRNTVRDLLGALSIPVSGDLPGGQPCGTATFALDDPGMVYGSVAVAGSFNGWDAGAWPMAYDSGAGQWVRTEILGEGTFQYKFVVDGAWIADPANPDQADDGYGGANSVLNLSCTAALDLGALTANFPVESRPQGFPFDNSAAAGLVSASHADAHLLAAGAVAAAIAADLDGAVQRIAACAPADPGCDAAFAADFGALAFRRPLTEAQIARYTALIQAEGFPLAIEAMLSSPYFLYRSELGADQGDGTFQLDGYELASAMSYFYWASLPDAALLAAAADGSLLTDAGIRAQAARMLADPRARDRLARFAEQWLGAEPVLTTEKAVEFPAEIRAAMLEEAGGFVAGVAFDGSGEFSDLLLAAPAPSAALVGWYGTAGSAERGGLLGLGAVLATTAHSDQTSPVRRGLFVRERLLCQEFGPPPAEAGGVPDIDPDATTRERFATHTADPNCAACHRYIDPVGFGFEHFDPTGRWRDTDGGLPIDASGDLADIAFLGQGSSLPFSTLPDLSAALAGSDRAPACYTAQVMRLALGWQPELDEVCAYDAIRLGFKASGYDLQELMILATLSDPFRLRVSP